MPRYYFHVKDGETLIDHDGIELRNVDTMRNEALTSAGEMLQSMDRPNFWSGHPWTLWVTDEPAGDGEPILTLQFVERQATSAELAACERRIVTRAITNHQPASLIHILEGPSQIKFPGQVRPSSSSQTRPDHFIQGALRLHRNQSLKPYDRRLRLLRRDCSCPWLLASISLRDEPAQKLTRGRYPYFHASLSPRALQTCSLGIFFMRKPAAYDSKGHKICPRCLLAKPNSEYYFVGHARNRLSHFCKSCTRERARLSSPREKL